MEHFGTVAFTPAVVGHQVRRGSAEAYRSQTAQAPPAGLGPDEVEFLRERDSIFLASTGEGGWPYVQHRGGPPGFVRVVDPTHLAWAERVGNRQFITAGNLDHDDRVALIAVDQPNRRRLKLLGHATWDREPTVAALAALGLDGRAEAILHLEVVAFDWNCPKHITPRYTVEEIAGITTRLTADLTARIAALEAEVSRLTGERRRR